jgi:hypothetical protein
MINNTPAIVLVLVLAILMIISVKSGQAISEKRKDTDVKRPEISSAVIAAMFALLGFILAFTYNMSESRFDKRRQHIVEESNNIGTALLRADLYPDSLRTILRQNFYQYILARIEYYKSGRDEDSINTVLNKATSFSGEIWQMVSRYAKDHPEQWVASGQMIPAVNSMIDIVSTRHSAVQSKVPALIILMLFLLCLATSFFSGYSFGKNKPDWLIIFGFVFTISIVIYITFDLDRPRRGIIRSDKIHHFMENLVTMFTEEEVKNFKLLKNN